MKSLKIPILYAWLLVAGLSAAGTGQVVDISTAQNVAEHWIDVIVQKKGSWGDANTAHITHIEQFKRGNRLLGYFCAVEPIGFIIVSLRQELAPVKAYSARTELDPDMDEGMADLLKARMESILDRIEQRFGSVTAARPEDVSDLFEVDYRPAWDQLKAPGPPTQKALAPVESAAATYVEGGNYQEGRVLLETRWHQGHPYNLYCPAPPPGSDCTADHCTVGCNATAGAQVLRHWCWPPWGEGGNPFNDVYEWWNIPNTLSGSSPSEQIHATAELNYEVGIAAEPPASYCVIGCATASHIKEMQPGYVAHFRYSGSWVPERGDYTASEWFNLIKAQLNKNRPMTYGVPGHAIVCDGWQVVSAPPAIIRQYHLNYGWGGGSDAWYTLDTLSEVPEDVEHLLADHFPTPAIGSTVVMGTYQKNPFPYWYFDQDATAYFTTTFASGNYLQFLHGIRLRAAGHVRIESAPAENTRLFSRGDPTHGIRLYGGTMTLYSGGSVKLY